MVSFSVSIPRAVSLLFSLFWRVNCFLNRQEIHILIIERIVQNDWQDTWDIFHRKEPNVRSANLSTLEGIATENPLCTIYKFVSPFYVWDQGLQLKRNPF
jgi:hypothetical protein